MCILYLFHSLSRYDLFLCSYIDRSREQLHKLLHDDMGSRINIGAALNRQEKISV